MKVALITLLCITMFGNLKAAGEQSAKEIIIKAERMLLGGDCIKYENLLKVRNTSSKREKVYQVIGHRKGENVIIEFIKPEVEKGRKVLVKDMVGYMFFPNTSKPMRLTLQSGLMGSGFSLGDLSADIFLKYKIESQKDTLINDQTCSVYNLIKMKKVKAQYSRIEYTISNNCQPVFKKYYSLSGKAMKFLELTKPKVIGGQKIPSVWTMNSLISNEVTIVEIINLTRNVKLKDKIFSINYVKSMR